MSKQLANKSIAAALTTAVLTFAAVNPAGAADQSDHWFEQQSVTDGISVEIQRDATPKGARSRVGEPMVSSEQAGSHQEDWLIQQLRKSEGSAE